MAHGRIRRTARRGVAVAVLGWLSVAAASVLLASPAGAAPAATIEIRNVTPPVASVDPGGTVTFVNKIPAENRGGISIPLVGSVSATVFTDVTVDFFGQPRPLQPEQSTAWKFSAPATTGTITYTYRIVPQTGLAAPVVNQVVATIAAQLPPLPAPIPYVVQTIAPALPNLPSVGIPQLPQVTLPALPGGVLPTPTPTTPGQPLPTPGPAPAPAPAPPVEGAGNPYTYGTGGVAALSPRNGTAAAAFDPSRFLAAGSAVAARGGSGGGTGGGSGGMAGTYDGATVPVFGQLAGLNGGTTLDEESAEQAAAASTVSSSTLPAAALAAVVALAAVSAALVRTHQASRADR